MSEIDPKESYRQYRLSIGQPLPEDWEPERTWYDELRGREATGLTVEYFVPLYVGPPVEWPNKPLPANWQPSFLGWAREVVFREEYLGSWDTLNSVEPITEPGDTEFRLKIIRESDPEWDAAQSGCVCGGCWGNLDD